MVAEEPKSEAELTEIPVSEILDKMQKGEPIKYDHIIVRCHIDVSKLDLPKEGDKFHISSLITITYSHFLYLVEFNTIVFQKNVDFLGTTFGGDHEFFGCASFFNSQFDKLASFSFANFEDSVNFGGSKFKWGADFMYCEFKGPVNFSESQFDAEASFIRSLFYPDADFRESRFNRGAFFGGCKFNGINFEKTGFIGEADFKESEFGRETNFSGVQFNGKIELDDSKFIDDVLTFKNAEFNEPRSQENVCRKAKNVLEKNGDREEAGYHFYREMVGKRRQKPWYIRYPEFLFLQLIFGYGVHPWWLMYWWLLIVIIFSNIYLTGNGIVGIENWFDYIKISFAFGIAPGYIAAIINPASAGYKLIPMYQAVAIIETIVGTFLWAGFIATFAKKYMK
jgi:uncharacterized protein YjbI with pentapeptide repeats